MALAFHASQKLDLPVIAQSTLMETYLQEKDRVIEALLDPRQLSKTGEGTYTYTVTTLQVFQLQVRPVVSLAVSINEGILCIQATEATLDGLGLVDDFQLSLKALLQATERGLQGEATLGVNVSQPPLLRLIPRRVLESTGESILNGILITIKGRVGRQLINDFQDWCRESHKGQNTASAQGIITGKQPG